MGAGKPFGESVEYFAPSISATDKLFSQLVKDQPTFTSFLIETAKAVTTIGARKQQLSELVEHGNTTFQAIGSQQAALAAGLKELPAHPAAGQQDLRRRARDARRPDAADRNLEARDRPADHAAAEAAPARHDLHAGARQLQQRDQQARQEQRPDRTAQRPAGARKDAHHRLAGERHGAAGIGSDHQLLRPYSPDLAGTLRSFGQAASYYDANGHYARVSPILPDFKLGGSNNLTPTTGAAALEGLKTGQIRRCPGGATQPAADGSSPFADNELLTCDPLQTP